MQPKNGTKFYLFCISVKIKITTLFFTWKATSVIANLFHAIQKLEIEMESGSVFYNFSERLIYVNN